MSGASDAGAATGRLLWQDTVHAGAHWSGVFRRGLALTLTDLEGGANAAVLLYSAGNPLERYNMADTLKAQHTAYLTRGCVCYSDMGRILCSITADECGWHDTFCGVSSASMVEERHGRTSYQRDRNDRFLNGYDSLLTELGKYGLGPRDVVPNINFFSKVVADVEGRLAFVPGHSRAGQSVELRFEMPTLLVMSTCPHPLDPASRYAPKPVQLTVREAGPVAADDPCRVRCPENVRGFVNTERAMA